MEVSDSGEKVVDQFRDPRPGHAILLAASLKRASPEFDDPVAERRKGPTVGLHRIVSEVAGEDLLQPFSLLGNRLMPPLSHLGFHLLELGQQAVAPGFPFEQEFPIATDAADEGKAQKVESLRFSESALSASVRRKAAKLDQAGLLRVEGQRELLQGTSKNCDLREFVRV